MAQQRRKFSAEFKLDTVMEGLRAEEHPADLPRAGHHPEVVDVVHVYQPIG